MLSVKLQQNGLMTAEPYFLKPAAGDDGIIDAVDNLKKKVNNLKDELQQIDNKYELWSSKRHNQKFGIYFRGQPDCEYELVPSIGRPGKEYSLEQERNLLHRFRRRSYSHYQRILTGWEAIFLARHHELPTRLIDWTTNLLVALYWACESLPEKDGAVWAFVRQPDECYDLNVLDSPLHTEYKYGKEFQFLVKGVKVIYPFYVSPRMTAQGSIFTFQDMPTIPLERYPVENYCRENFDIFHIRKWKVPKGKKEGIIDELEEVGINLQTLFPDLEGLGKGIPQIEGLRTGNPT